MIHLKEPKEKGADDKPLFYCPYHKDKFNVTYFPFEPDNIFPCKFDDCPCKGFNGWCSTCKECGRVIHNCQFGCRKGIDVHNIVHLKRKAVIKKDALYSHYKRFHPQQKVYLYYEECSTLSPGNTQ